jgi:hypothetical protein
VTLEQQARLTRLAESARKALGQADRSNRFARQAVAQLLDELSDLNDDCTAEGGTADEHNQHREAIHA